MSKQILKLSQFKSYLQPRQRNAHKGDFGHLLIIGSDYGFIGAARLTAEAALRAGAGVVSVGSRPEHALSLNASRPEIICQSAHPKMLTSMLAYAQAIVIGPGLGQSSWAKRLFTKVMQSQKPMVIDADALRMLAKNKRFNNHWILTPHPGEAAALLHTSVQAIQDNREAAIKNIHALYGGVCVLKGSGTLIQGKTLALCTHGNPGMATAGMGDALAGILGGLLAQSIPLEVAAQLGVLIHALAGDAAAKEGERGMITSDIFPHLRRLINL